MYNINPSGFLECIKQTVFTVNRTQGTRTFVTSSKYINNNSDTVGKETFWNTQDDIKNSTTQIKAEWYVSTIVFF